MSELSSNSASNRPAQGSYDLASQRPGRETGSSDSTGSGHWQVLFLTVLAFTALACITINVYFPEAAVKDLSERIEEAVARTAAEAEEPDAGEGNNEDASSESEGSRAAWIDPATLPTPPLPEDLPEPSYSVLERAAQGALGLVLAVTASPAHAQEVVAPEISNPAIRQIITSRSQRVSALESYKSQGALGENNQALVEVRDLNALPLQERARVQKLVRDENADRDRMFKEIAAATNVDLAQLPKIQETYAETLRQNAAKGHWIQQPSGEWMQKR